jgi:NAD(P)-dependent dehydrogenase (short-subunit alcohol dehydrogenase family)
MTRRNGWTLTDVPDQAGKTFLVTGATSGIGLETVRALASSGGSVILTCRSATKGQAALADVRQSVPDAHLQLGSLDLASLASVRDFAAWVDTEDLPVDVIINNAGIMAVPHSTTSDGFESQFGVNHLGHFALVGLLLDRLLESETPRVVSVSSLAHRTAKLDFHDLMSTRRYSRFGAYSQSKLANLLFTMELQRRLRSVDKGHVLSVACHPGISTTNLSGGVTGGLWGKAARVSQLSRPTIAQSSSEGALPTLRAATDPDAKGGDYFGPRDRMETKGPAVKVKARPKAFDVHDARGLWEASVELTGVDYAALIPSE